MKGPHLFFIAFLLCLFSFQACAAQFSTQQVILVLWHGLELEELEFLSSDPDAAWALFNTRAGGGDQLTGAYLSLGAGARAVGLAGSAAFLGDRGALELYKLHTGLEPGVVVLPQIALLKGAQSVNYRYKLGALGEAFKNAGLPILAVGNSDEAQFFRLAALVSMDGDGRVWQAEVGAERLVTDPSFPFGVRTDYQFLLDEITNSTAPLIVVDLGDPLRLQQYSALLASAQQKKLAAQVRDMIAQFLSGLKDTLPAETIIFVVSPFPSLEQARRGQWLTPMVCFGLEGGVLTSGTTRWPGLITNMDLAPTILEFLAIEHEEHFIGRSAWKEKQVLPFAYVRETERKIQVVARYRSVVLRSVIVAQILLYSGVLLTLIVQKPLSLKLMQVLQSALVLFLLVPLLLLVWSNWLILSVSLLAGGIITVVYQKRFLEKVGLIAFALLLFITYDLLRGNWLIRFSYLGYDASGGARFYGLGNEYMGIFVGAAVMGWAIFCHLVCLKQPYRELLGFLYFSFALILIGHPALGTNVGGAISGVCAFGAVMLSFKTERISWRYGVILASAVVAVLFALILIDSRNSGLAQSHIGQTVGLFERDGFAALRHIIVRKLAMNIKLLRHSMWSKALIVALGVMGASFIWPTKFISWLRKTYPLIGKGIGAIVLGSVAALIFNDSGVVAAATCLYFGSTVLLLLALELKHNFHSSQSHI